MTVQQTSGNSSEAPPPEPEPDRPITPEEAGTTADHHYPIDKVIFGVAAALVVAFIVWGIVSVESLSSVSGVILGAVIDGGGWAFVLAASGFVVFALWVAFSRYGKIPLGGDEEGP